MNGKGNMNGFEAFETNRLADTYTIAEVKQLLWQL